MLAIVSRYVGSTVLVTTDDFFHNGPPMLMCQSIFYSAHLTPKSPCSGVRKLVMEETLYPSAALSVNLNSTRVNMDANSYKLHASGYYDVLLLGKLPMMVSTVLGVATTKFSTSYCYALPCTTSGFGAEWLCYYNTIQANWI